MSNESIILSDMVILSEILKYTKSAGSITLSELAYNIAKAQAIHAFKYLTSPCIDHSEEEQIRVRIPATIYSDYVVPRYLCRKCMEEIERELGRGVKTTAIQKED